MEEGQKYQFFGQLVEYDEDDCTIELREDGTVEIYMDVYGASQDMTCEWEEIEDGEIVFTQGGIVIMTATVSGRTMTVSIGSDTTIILKK
jgi:preprotein translocase subunit YajC